MVEREPLPAVIDVLIVPSVELVVPSEVFTELTAFVVVPAVPLMLARELFKVFTVEFSVASELFVAVVFDDMVPNWEFVPVTPLRILAAVVLRVSSLVPSVRSVFARLLTAPVISSPLCRV